MDRRDFLLLRTGCGQPLELSGERLYMRFVDAQAEGAVEALFDGLALELKNARAVRLIDVSWLDHDGLKPRVDLLLAQFCARGGRVFSNFSQNS